MDANETIETLGAKPMVELLDTIGGWNISGKFNVSAWSLQTSMHVLQNVYNMDGLFTWAVNEDERNSTRHIIQVSTLGISRDLYGRFAVSRVNGLIGLCSFLDGSRRPDVADHRQLSERHRARQGVGRLFGLHDEGTAGIDDTVNGSRHRN